jgi:hypothetical protein
LHREKRFLLAAVFTTIPSKLLLLTIYKKAMSFYLKDPLQAKTFLALVIRFIIQKKFSILLRNPNGGR